MMQEKIKMLIKCINFPILQTILTDDIYIL